MGLSELRIFYDLFFYDSSLISADDIHWQHCVRVWASQCKYAMDSLELVHHGATKMVRALEHLSYQTGLREQFLLSLQKIVFRDEFNKTFKNLMEQSKKELSQAPLAQ